MGLDYVDIYYHHRMDPDTRLEETLQALDSTVRQGKALYIGISRYDEETTEKAIQILHDLGTPFIIEQQRYSMFDRWLKKEGKPFLSLPYPGYSGIRKLLLF